DWSVTGVQTCALPILAGQVAPDGQGARRRAQPGADGLYRLPVRRTPDPAAPGPVRRGSGGRGGMAGHLREGELLPGADGPWPGQIGRASCRERAEVCV